jgi:hypothetical protein
MKGQAHPVVVWFNNKPETWWTTNNGNGRERSVTEELVDRVEQDAAIAHPSSARMWPVQVVE